MKHLLFLLLCSVATAAQVRVGDVYTHGGKDRILCYDMMNSYFFINSKGYQVCDNMKSFDEVAEYMIKKKYEHKKTSLLEYLNRTNMLAAESILFNRLDSYGIANKYKAHAAASAMLVMLGPSDCATNLSPLEMIVQSGKEALDVGIYKEEVLDGHRDEGDIIADMIGVRWGEILCLFRELEYKGHGVTKKEIWRYGDK